MAGLSLQVIKENDRDREDERLRPHDPISEHLLWLMMHHIRRRQVSLSYQLNPLALPSPLPPPPPLSLWIKSKSVTIQMKATEQYFPVISYPSSLIL